jgi:hypothetical protein
MRLIIAALDTAVLTAYGFSAKKDLLAQPLALNQQVAAKIEKGEPVMPPGVPKNYPDAKKLMTEDCIKPLLGEKSKQPSGKAKWFDNPKGYGFIVQEGE